MIESTFGLNAKDSKSFLIKKIISNLKQFENFHQHFLNYTI